MLNKILSTLKEPSNIIDYNGDVIINPEWLQWAKRHYTDDLIYKQALKDVKRKLTKFKGGE